MQRVRSNIASCVGCGASIASQHDAKRHRCDPFPWWRVHFVRTWAKTGKLVDDPTLERKYECGAPNESTAHLNFRARYYNPHVVFTITKTERIL